MCYELETNCQKLTKKTIFELAQLCKQKLKQKRHIFEMIFFNKSNSLS